MATRDDAVLVVQSFSKTYCMTGWRVGWLIGRRDLGQKATQLNEFIVSHAPSFAQRAAEIALAHGEPELLAMLERLRHNRDLCLSALEVMPGVTVPKPDGAFYLFPKIAGLTDSFGFCQRLLEECRVGLDPELPSGRGEKDRCGSVTRRKAPSSNRRWNALRHSSKVIPLPFKVKSKLSGLLVLLL